MDISVVIPAYNEEKRIGQTLKKLNSYLKNEFKRFEIIIVDDGSSDRTPYLIKKSKNTKLLQNKVNRGKGYSVRKGILNARYGLVLFTDVDLSTPIKEVERMINFINKGYHIVIASRRHVRSIVSQPTFRKFLGFVFSIFVKIIVVRGFKDTQCGFKLFVTKEAKKIFQMQKIGGYTFDVETLFLAKRLNLKIKELSTVWNYRRGSKITIIKHSWSMLYNLFRIRINSLLGKYS